MMGELPRCGKRAAGCMNAAGKERHRTDNRPEIRPLGQNSPNLCFMEVVGETDTWQSYSGRSMVQFGVLVQKKWAYASFLKK